jgi:glutamate racemase
MLQTPDFNAPIGVFDSGVGGLSVLRALRAALPLERFIYFADSAHAPYGEKGDAYVLQRSNAITETLIHEYGIKALVVACNTATAAAIAPLRSAHPDLIIIGIEPALKPAAAASASKRVAVLATRGTLASKKFKALLATQSTQAQFICQPCDGLAEAIETHIDDLNAPAIQSLVAQNLSAVGACDTRSGIDTLVLGCTHYPLIKSMIAAHIAPHIQIIDNGLGVANQLTVRLKQQGLLALKPSPDQPVQFLSSAATTPDWQSLLAI